MDYRHAVVNANGDLIEVVNVISEEIQGYVLTEGEFLVEDLTFQGMLNPKWDGEKWFDDLSQEELEEIQWEKFLEIGRASCRERV